MVTGDGRGWLFFLNTIWWEGARGMKEKLESAAERHLAGVALRRLGYDEEEFWEYVRRDSGK